MRAIILAAGRGSRMGTATDLRPKALTELAGKPLLEWQLESLDACGAEVAVVTGYRPETLAPWVSRFGLQAFHNARWKETNMVASLAEARSWLQQGQCLVSYADIVFHPAIPQALWGHPGTELALTYDVAWRSLWELRSENPLSDTETFRVEGGRVLEIGRRPRTLDEVQGQYMGLVRWSPSAWQRAEKYRESLPVDQADTLDMTTLLRALLEVGVPLEGVPVEGRWCEVDSQADCARYQERLAKGAWEHDWRWSSG